MASYPGKCRLPLNLQHGHSKRVLTKYPHTPVAADARGKEKFPICHFKDEERRQRALGLSCLAAELTAVGFLYWKG